MGGGEAKGEGLASGLGQAQSVAFSLPYRPVWVCACLSLRTQSSKLHAGRCTRVNMCALCIFLCVCVCVCTLVPLSVGITTRARMLDILCPPQTCSPPCVMPPKTPTLGTHQSDTCLVGFGQWETWPTDRRAGGWTGWLLPHQAVAQ